MPSLNFNGPICRICGCDDMHACVTNGVPCYWVEEDLCSACADCPGCSPDCQRGSGCCDPRNDVGEEANP